MPSGDSRARPSHATPGAAPRTFANPPVPDSRSCEAVAARRAQRGGTTLALAEE